MPSPSANARGFDVSVKFMAGSGAAAAVRRTAVDRDGKQAYRGVVTLSLPDELLELKI